PRLGAYPLLFFAAEEGIRVFHVTGVQTCAPPICPLPPRRTGRPRTGSTRRQRTLSLPPPDRTRTRPPHRPPRRRSPARSLRRPRDRKSVVQGKGRARWARCPSKDRVSARNRDANR